MSPMLPLLLLQHIAQPGAFEAQLLAYLKAAGYKVGEVSKTIAGTAYYHFRTVATLNTQSFFVGQVEADQTNMPTNNFVRPEGEHQVIYGVRYDEGTGILANGITWTAGAATTFSQNTVFTITVNNIVKVKDYPVNEAMQDLTTRDFGYIPLAEPIVWGGQETMSLVQYSKPNTVVGAAAAWARWTLLAIGLI